MLFLRRAHSPDCPPLDTNPLPTDNETRALTNAPPGRTETEQPESATIHVSNTMLTNDSMSYVVIPAYPGIEIDQQYNFVALRNTSEGGIQRVMKAIFYIIR